MFGTLRCATDWMPTSRSQSVYGNTAATMNCSEEARQQLVTSDDESDEEQDRVQRQSTLEAKSAAATQQFASVSTEQLMNVKCLV